MRVTTTVLLLTISTAAASNENKMEHVLVSVPIHKKTAETALPVTILSGEGLRRQAAATIGETLGNTPGVANASFGPAVGQPVIRGQQGPRVTVLQNGTSSADVSTSSADHAVATEPLLADSIEILRGPASLLYGGGAIGGVVNILDNRIPVAPVDELQGGAEYRYDSASNMDSAVGRLEGGNGKMAFHLSGLNRQWGEVEIPGYASAEDRDEDSERGIIPNSDGETTSILAGASLHFDKGFFGLAVNQLDNEYGIPTGSHSHDDHEEDEEEIRIDMEQRRYDAVVHLHEPLTAIEVVRGFYTYTDYEHKEIEGNGEIGTRFENDSQEARLEVVHQPMGGWHGVLGMQWRRNEYSALGEEAFVPLTDKTGFGIFLVEDYHHGDWTFEAGFRYDNVERDPDTAAARKRDFDSYSVSGSALWDLSTQWNLGIGISSSERAPVTEELYSNIEATSNDELVVHAATSSIEIGDPNLQQETSRNVDLTASWLGDGYRVSLNMFYNDFKDYIALGNTGQEVEEIRVLAYLQDDAEFYGGELDARFELAQLGDGELGLNLGGDMVRGKLDNLGDMPRLPPYRVSGELNWQNNKFFTYMRVLNAADQDRAGENESETEGYTRWDAGAEFQHAFSAVGDVTLFLKLKNISDEEIRLSTSVLREIAPEPGRSVEAGLRFTF